MNDQTVPRHIGYIVDGNRRWARERGQGSYKGHLAGYKVLKEIASYNFELGVQYVSAYVWSTENWKRSKEETNKLMGLLVRALNKDISLFMEKNIRLKVLGSRESVSEKVLEAIDKAESITKNNDGGVLAMCFNYGGQQEIVDAVKKIVQADRDPSTITPAVISEYVYQPDVPAVDLIVRTGGEQRLSNFMLWRSAYSELIFVDKYWPDLERADVDVIIDEYSHRTRRFGA